MFFFQTHFFIFKKLFFFYCTPPRASCQKKLCTKKHPRKMRGCFLKTAEPNLKFIAISKPRLHQLLQFSYGATSCQPPCLIFKVQPGQLLFSKLPVQTLAFSVALQGCSNWQPFKSCLIQRQACF